MIAINLNSTQDAKDFAKYFNNRKYFEIEPDFCVVFALIAARIHS
jgi:hypothetical protein